MNEQLKAMVITKDGRISVGYIEKNNERMIVLNKSKRGEIHKEGIPKKDIQKIIFQKKKR